MIKTRTFKIKPHETDWPDNCDPKGRIYIGKNHDQPGAGQEYSFEEYDVEITFIPKIKAVDLPFQLGDIVYYAGYGENKVSPEKYVMTQLDMVKQRFHINLADDPWPESVYYPFTSAKLFTKEAPKPVFKPGKYSRTYYDYPKEMEPKVVLRFKNEEEFNAYGLSNQWERIGD